MFVAGTMALSCYSNWDEETEANLKWNIQPQMELLPPNPEFLLEVDSNNLLFSDNSHVDPFMDYCYSQELFNYNSSSSSSSLLPFISSPQENLYSLVSEIFPPVQEYYEQPNYHYNLKRQKVYEEESFINPGFLLPNPTTGLSQNLEILGPFPSFGNINNNVPSVCGNKTVEATKKGGSFSAQSIAARQRRRKITEKTQELGKLIPGGQKMNTAEMFSAAFKYIKFLQTQVRILETMASIHQVIFVPSFFVFFALPENARFVKSHS